jgi:Family of unknown function (DUF6130)
VRRVGGRTAALCIVAAIVLAACTSSGSGADPGSTTPATTGPRPASPAVVKILQPKNGATEPASGAKLQVSLTGAKLTSVTSQDISPTEGHLHVSVDDRLISMTSGLTQTLPDLTPGRHTIRVEFVASDHLPFDPRVVTEAFFEVK